MMEVGTWTHFITDIITTALLFAGVPLAYLFGMARGRRQVDPVAKAEHALVKEAMAINVLGVCGVHPLRVKHGWEEAADYPCQRVAGHKGHHIHKNPNGTRIAWEDEQYTKPRTLND